MKFIPMKIGSDCTQGAERVGSPSLLRDGVSGWVGMLDFVADLIADKTRHSPSPNSLPEGEGFLEQKRKKRLERNVRGVFFDHYDHEARIGYLLVY
jgi:hypothetical protein